MNSSVNLQSIPTEFQTVQEQLDFNISSVLKFPNDTLPLLKGNYTCRANNSEGSNSVTFTVRRLESSDPSKLVDILTIFKSAQDIIFRFVAGEKQKDGLLVVGILLALCIAFLIIWGLIALYNFKMGLKDNTRVLTQKDRNDFFIGSLSCQIQQED